MDLNSLCTNPLFINTEKNDFLIQSESPAVDKGKNVGLTKDFFGTQVPMNGIPDIGITEFQYNQYTSVPFINEDKNEQISVFPNPSDGIFNIRVMNPIYVFNKLEIKKITGETLICDYLQLEGKDNQIDITELPSGIYILNLSNDDMTTTHKVIIN
jgi:hypothetical protein